MRKKNIYRDIVGDEMKKKDRIELTVRNVIFNLMQGVIYYLFINDYLMEGKIILSIICVVFLLIIVSMQTKVNVNFLENRMYRVRKGKLNDYQ
ncbi:hypothetical protein [Oceanobacillus oncorhynchi]|uniref:hypothetical protein n=1 Tax=Oceanobacillus oncorhynchi TaxID=545501 RepID=UPI0034D4B0D3